MARTIDPMINASPSRRAAAEQFVFGAPLPDDEYGNLVGDVSNDATIKVEFFVRLSNRRFPIQISAVSSLFSSTVVRIGKGQVEYSDCVVRGKNLGTGRDIFRLLATTAKNFGFPCIEAEGRKYESAEHPEKNCYGHYVYVKYGFDADIPPKAPARPDELTHHLKLLDLTSTPEGLLWWKLQGETVPHMVFDLADNSRSWQRFEAGNNV